MKGKFWIFFTITLVLFGAVFGMYWRYIHVGTYGVFIESYDHGTMTVDSDDTTGNDRKYRVMVKKGNEIVININPERTDNTYYVLDKLTVNGENVTDDVSMLQYKTVVEQKLTVVATFKKGTRPENSSEETTAVKATQPNIEKYADNEYIGSYAAYDIKDPSIVYDKESGLYYCFGSDNVVVKSTDLVNWYGRTTYFMHPENATSNAIMAFSQFESVNAWAKEHGYDMKDEVASDKNNNRTPHSPEIVMIDDTYYLYFALTKTDGSNESAIFCVKTDNLEESLGTKKWEDVGLVISTCSGEKANAVHPSVFKSEDSKMYMVYGGYHGNNESIDGEINLIELERSTGLLKVGSSVNTQGESLSEQHGIDRFKSGTLIADPGAVPALGDGSGSLVCGADIAYNEDNGYYYMFVTYGTEGTNYNVRVARSKNITGPYTDREDEDMAAFSKNMYDKGHLILGGYNFTNSSVGRVSYTDVGRASIGSPKIIKSTDGTWFVACQSQVYYKVDSTITTGSAKAEEKGLKINSAPSLEIRELMWDDRGWPYAMPEVYSGEAAKSNVKLSELYGNWDIIIFGSNGDKKDYRAVERSQSQIVTILSSAVISQKDIDKNNEINTGCSFAKSGNGYTITIDGVVYTVYARTLWDWELKEGSIVIIGVGEDGSTIWGKKNISEALGLYTDAFYYLYNKCEGENAATIAVRIEKMKNNPSQALIDKYTNWMARKLTTVVTTEAA